MAPTNQALARQPSKEEQEREESSDEEENSESDSGETEEEEGSSEEEEENPVSTKPQALVHKSESKLKSKATLVNASDSDAETEGSPPPDYKVEPIRKPSPVKREREEGQNLSRSSKKLKTEEKKTPASTPGGGGGGIIARLWSDEDEIAVLNGMIEFRKVKGNDNNIEEIYNFIKGKLQGEFNKLQLRTKITRMKKRFMNALKKSSDPVFSKPHEDMAFELSKKIWGDAVNGNVNANVKKEVIKNGNGNVKKETVKAEVEEKDDAEETDFWSKYPYLSSSFFNMKGISEASVNLLKENMSSIGDSKAKELNQKWRQLFLEEAEVNHKMLILIAEQTKLGLNQINDS